MEKRDKILITDDTQDKRNILSLMLKKEGFTIVTATNGKEGVAAVQRENPDLILMDIMMPEMDGFLATTKIRELVDVEYIPIIITTVAKDDPQGIMHAFECGADDYISMPCEKYELIARVKSLVRIKHLTMHLNKKNSELTTAYEQLRVTQQNLISQAKMASIGTLVGGIAHEFNNLLFIASGFAQMAKGQGNEALYEGAIDTILDVTKRGNSLITSLLSFAKEVNPKKEKIQLDSIVERVILLLKKECDENNIKVERDYSHNPHVEIDISQIEHAIFNVMKNSIQAIEKNGRIRFTISKKDENAVLSIWDSGCGIKREYLDRIFDPFFTTKGAYGGGRIQGTGLGLSLALGMVEKNGGKIYAESEQGQFSEVFILFPTVAEDLIEEEAVRIVERIDSDKKAKSKVVLMVDDEDDILRIFELYARGKDFTLICANNEDDAIKIFSEERIDLVIMDVMLPKIGGINLASRFRLERPDVKVIFITGKFSDNSSTDFTKTDVFLLKPFDFHELEGLIYKLLTE